MDMFLSIIFPLTFKNWIFINFEWILTTPSSLWIPITVLRRWNVINYLSCCWFLWSMHLLFHIYSTSECQSENFRNLLFPVIVSNKAFPVWDDNISRHCVIGFGWFQESVSISGFLISCRKKYLEVLVG